MAAVLILYTPSFAQTHRVLLEEFTGANCGNCPMGHYYVDSMLHKHPNLIVVSVHSYTVKDSMAFATIDTLGEMYSAGAPLAAIDRLCPGTTSNTTGIVYSQWDANIQQRLQTPVSVSVSIAPTWNASNRIIQAGVDVHTETNLPSGDYRIGLYIVEDSVVGSANGYDQSNFYSSTPGNPFFGLGFSITNYVHKHVARALLTSTWSLPGIISATPVSGNHFHQDFSYTLPVGYDENNISLVAFVYRYTSNHTGDEVLNAAQVELPLGMSDVSENDPETSLQVYPNPTTEYLLISGLPAGSHIRITDMNGRLVLQANAEAETLPLNVQSLAPGLYSLSYQDETGLHGVKRFLIVR